MRIFAGIFIIAVYLLWLAYHGLVKKDLKQNLNALYAYSAFAAIWSVIFLAIYFSK